MRDLARSMRTLSEWHSWGLMVACVARRSTSRLTSITPSAAMSRQMATSTWLSTGMPRGDRSRDIRFGCNEYARDSSVGAPLLAGLASSVNFVGACIDRGVCQAHGALPALLWAVAFLLDRASDDPPVCMGRPDYRRRTAPTTLWREAPGADSATRSALRCRADMDVVASGVQCVWHIGPTPVIPRR